MSVLADVDIRGIEQFLYREARLADTHDYEGWEALWVDDATYWVPAGRDDDPNAHMSIINDNRRRISTRIAQLETGRRYSQAPPSRLARTIGNVEVIGLVGGDGPDAADLVVSTTFLLLESRERATITWGGRLTYHLRPAGDGYQLSHKKVDLVDRPWALPNISFLI